MVDNYYIVDIVYSVILGYSVNACGHYKVCVPFSELLQIVPKCLVSLASLQLDFM